MADGPGEATKLERELRYLADKAGAMRMTIHVDDVQRLAGEAADALVQLRTALAEACDAFAECFGPLAQQLAGPELDRWRALANPLFAEAEADPDA